MDPNAEPMPPMPEPPPDNAVVGVPANPVPPVRGPDAKAKAKNDLILNGVYFGLAVVAIGIVFGLVKLWARRQSDDCNTPVSLGSYREMLESGELSREEYDQILAKMAAKMKGGQTIQRIVPKPSFDGDVGRNGTPPTPENPS